MAKLTDRQKVNIVAKWNTGVYTKSELAKAYKISDVMVGKIVGKEEPKNADIVEAGIIVERAKKLDKSSVEISAINDAIKYRLEKEFNKDNNKIKIFDATADIIKGVHDLIKKGKAQKVVTSKMGSDVINIDLQAIDYKNAIDTIDKAGQTLGVIDRFAPKVEVNVGDDNSIQDKRVLIVRREN